MIPSTALQYGHNEGENNGALAENNTVSLICNRAKDTERRASVVMQRLKYPKTSMQVRHFCGLGVSQGRFCVSGSIRAGCSVAERNAEDGTRNNHN